MTWPYSRLVPAKTKKSKPAKRRRFSALPAMEARFNLVMTVEEKAELESATLRLGYSSMARFMVAAGLKMARETKPR